MRHPVSKRGDAPARQQVGFGSQARGVRDEGDPWHVDVPREGWDHLRHWDVDMGSCWKVLKLALGLQVGKEDLEIQQGRRSCGYKWLPMGEGMCGCPEPERGLVRYLNRVVASWSEDFEWAVLDLYHNESPEGLCSGDSDSWIVAMGEFSGGGLWVEDVLGKGPLVIRDQEGVMRTGGVVDIHGSPTRVYGGQLCGRCPGWGKNCAC